MENRKLSKNSVIIIAMVAVWLVIVGTIIYLTLTVSVAVSERKIPVYRVVTDEKKVALTFNCAWDDSTTDRILDILEEKGIRCTFFFVGDFARKYPEDVRKIVNAGHEPANHSDRHRSPSKQSYAELLSDISSCNDEIKSLTGRNCTLYRAPSGEYTNDAVSAAESLGMTAVQWDVDSIDWKGKTPAEILERVRSKTVNGSILLFHLGKENTAEVLPQVTEYLQNSGYSFVTVSELLPDGDYDILPDGAAKPRETENASNTDKR